MPSWPDPTEISGAFKILSSLISWSQIRCLEGFGNFGIFSSCENLKWGIFLLLLLFNLEWIGAGFLINFCGFGIFKIFLTIFPG